MEVRKVQIHLPSLKDESELPSNRETTRTEPAVTVSQTKCRNFCSCDICQVWFDFGGEA